MLPDFLNNSKEELNFDLKLYLRESPFGLGVFHPLVYSLIYNPNMNEWLNKCYDQKLKATEEALKNKDYSQFIWLHERPYRLQAFMKIKDSLSTIVFNELLAAIWIDSENIHQNFKEWSSLIKEVNPIFFMTEEEIKALEKMPDEITIYRGGRKKGFSWTLSKEKAQWFSVRFQQKGTVHTRKIKKSEVKALILRRNEDEIIIC